MVGLSHFREPIARTLLRTGGIAIAGGAVLARHTGGWSAWPAASLLILWPSLGGHFVEVWFLNWLRPRVSSARAVQVAARIAVWFAAGVCLAIAMQLTATVLETFRTARWLAWWRGGLGFIGIELVVHLAPALRGGPSFYDGRG